LSWLGAASIGVGAVAYVVDVATVLLGSTVEHRPPQYFIGAALLWLVTALALGTGTLAGLPWQAAFGFVMLAGWAGQMVNGHVLHIGVRLIATIYRGDDDETRPGALLDSRWSWFVFGAMQLAVAALACGLLLRNSSAAVAGALLGLAGWLAMATALAKARAAAKMLSA
jgi:hypothetical protein